MDYADAVERAERTFRHQICYDPKRRTLVPLRPYPPSLQAPDLPYAGSMDLSAEMVEALCVAGSINPKTLEPIAAREFSLFTFKRLNEMKLRNMSRGAHAKAHSKGIHVRIWGCSNSDWEKS